jgi:hypothetical protein
MSTFALWLGKPLPPKSLFVLWLAFAVLVFTIWVLVPIFLGIHFEAKYLAIHLSLRNLAVILTRAFGEECVSRVVPIVLILAIFPKKVVLALLVGMVVAYQFGMWHDEFVYPVQICRGIGGAILAVAYLKFGGASKNPFRGLVACGSIHATCNIATVIIANIVAS